MAIQNEKGSVSIDAQNIMPVIKRWLYSDKDIFLREAVSNACDAITKFRMLHPDSEEPMAVTVAVDKEQKIIRISDTGIGMTDEEVRKYINQVAFSGASEFMKQFEDKPEEKGDIIGHFGLGFYSVFMVSDKVEIETLSSEGEAEPVHWVSEPPSPFRSSACRLHSFRLRRELPSQRAWRSGPPASPDTPCIRNSGSALPGPSRFRGIPSLLR